MSASALLSRLDGVKQTGAGCWIALCPGHLDRSPSLSIRELDDGRVLVHDFAGCSTEEVLAAVGLEFDSLFPERPLADHVPRQRAPFNALDVLRCVAFEATVVQCAAAAVIAGEPVTAADRERLGVAVARIQEALSFAGGSR